MAGFSSPPPIPCPPRALTFHPAITEKGNTVGHLYRNGIDLNDNTKQSVIGMLNARLADTIDLALVIKQAHWNLKGPDFIAIHLMLDTLRDEVDEHVDTIAERVSQLGGTPQGTVQAVAAATRLAPYPADIHTIPDHLSALAERFAQVGNAVRRNIDEADEAGDQTTADLFTGVSRGLDKNLWFLESHLQEKRA